MLIFKKLIILSAIGALLHLQLPLTGAADAKPAKITANKPQLAGTAEEFLPGAGPSGGILFTKRHMWIVAGVVAALALAIGATGGGGGGSEGRDNPPDDQEPGGVEVEW